MTNRFAVIGDDVRPLMSRTIGLVVQMSGHQMAIDWSLIDESNPSVTYE
jgi:hypothetical protein